MVITSLFSLAQDIKQDIIKINQTYDKQDKMAFDYEIQMFETYTSNKVYFNQKGSTKKMGNCRVQIFDDSECLITPSYAIMVDRDEKYICYTPKRTDFKDDDIGFMMNLDSISVFCKSYKFNKISENQNSYVFHMKDDYGDYEVVAVYFNSKTHFINKIVLYCDEQNVAVNNEKERLSKPRMEINYKNLDLNPKYNERDFTYQRYLVKQGSGFLVNQNYRTYELNVLKF